MEKCDHIEVGRQTTIVSSRICPLKSSEVDKNRQLLHNVVCCALTNQNPPAEDFYCDSFNWIIAEDGGISINCEKLTK